MAQDNNELIPQSLVTLKLLGSERPSPDCPSSPPPDTDTGELHKFGQEVVAARGLDPWVNTCFLNCALQQLARTRGFQSALEQQLDQTYHAHKGERLGEPQLGSDDQGKKDDFARVLSRQVTMMMEGAQPGVKESVPQILVSVVWLQRHVR